MTVQKKSGNLSYAPCSSLELFFLCSFKCSLRVVAFTLTSMLANLLPVSFLTHIGFLCHNLDERLCASIVLFSELFLCLYQRCFQLSYKRNSPCVYLFDEIFSAQFGFKKFPACLKYSFVIFFFFHLHLFDGVCSECSYVLVDFICHCVLILSLFGNSISSITSLLQLLLSKVHFSMPNYIPIS